MKYSCLSFSEEIGHQTAVGKYTMRIFTILALLNNFRFASLHLLPLGRRFISGVKGHFHQIGSENPTRVYAIHAEKDQPDATRTGSPPNRMQSQFNDDSREIRDLDETKLKCPIHPL